MSKTKKEGFWYRSSHGLAFYHALSKNFRKCNIPGVLASWMEYLTLSTFESITTLSAIELTEKFRKSWHPIEHR